MNDENNQKKQRFQANKKYFTICTYAIITFCIGLAIYKLTANWQSTQVKIGGILSMLSPFLIAFLIAYFVNPLIARINKHIIKKFLKNKLVRLHKLLSLAIAYIIVIGFIALILNFVIPQIISSIKELAFQSTGLINNFEGTLNHFLENNPYGDFLRGFYQNNLPMIFNYIESYSKDLIPAIYNAGISLISWLINILLAFVISCYLMWDKNKLLGSIKRIIYAVITKKQAEKVIDIIRECNTIFSRYIIGKAIDSLIIGILCFLLMCLLRLDYALLISLVVGITNMIPYFGPFIGAVPGLIILLIINPKSALIFLILIFLLQQFDGAILGPKILGDSTGLQPIWIIFAITVGGYLAGVVGMFLGVPIVAVMAHLLNKLVDFLLQKKNLPSDIGYKKEDDI